MPSYIRAIGTAVPPHRLPQARAADFLSAALDLTPHQADRLRRIFTQSGIEHRHTVVADYLAADPAEFRFYPNDPGLLPAPSTAARAAVYRDAALPLAVEAAQQALAQAPQLPAARITHVVTMSCTGMYAPGLDIDLVEALGLPPDVERTSVNFMGCYAAFHALKQADYILRADPAAVVLLAGVELCTLHFQNTRDGDHLAANALFADGAAAVLLSAQPAAAAGATAPPALRLDRFYSRLALDGRRDMAWHIGDHGFDIQLSSYVPRLLEAGIGELVQGLYARAGWPEGRAHRYAIHPGGLRILQACEAALGLSEADLAHSYQVLRDYGNMSSVTVLFVLRDLLAEMAATGARHERVLSCAFGPGLTLEALAGEVV